MDYPYSDGGLPKHAKGQDFGRLDLQLNYKFDEKYQIILTAKNVLNKKYIGYERTARETQNYYEFFPLDPLAVYIGLDIKFD
jgi:outer membrane receptor protein involved in Fe transport